LRGIPLAIVAIVATGCDGEASAPDPILASDLSSTLHGEHRAFAYVSWTQDIAGEVRVSYTVDEGSWIAAPPVQGVAGVNEQLLAGVPYGSEAQWRVSQGDTHFDAPQPIVTDPAPAQLPVGLVPTSEPTRWLPEGRFLLTTIAEGGGGWGTNGPFWTAIFDRAGRPIWAQRTRLGTWSLYPTVAQSGDHILYDEFDPFAAYSGNADAAQINRTYLDQSIESISTPGFHHAFVEHADGTLAWGSRAHGGGEALVEKAPGQDGETVVWTCNDDWPEASYYCVSNCLYYDADRDSYLYSFYTVESVVEIDRPTGTTMWWAGGVSGGATFEPADSQFYWQHGVSWTDAGTLLVSTHRSANGETNLAREYTYDESANTLTEIWSYDANALANTNGDTWRLRNGNTLHTLGSASQIKEVDADGQTVWHLDFNGTRLLGRSEWITDPNTLLAPAQ